jgi:hypothetical protein
VEHLLVPALLTIKSNERKHTRRRRWWWRSEYATTGLFAQRGARFDITSDRSIFKKCLSGWRPFPRPITVCTHTRIHLCSALQVLYTHIQSVAKLLYGRESERGACLSRTHRKSCQEARRTRERRGAHIGCQAKHTGVISGEAGEILKLGWG